MTATSTPLTNHTLEKGLDILGLFDDRTVVVVAPEPIELGEVDVGDTSITANDDHVLIVFGRRRVTEVR